MQHHWPNRELQIIEGLVRYANRIEDSHPLPSQRIIQHGVHLHLGPDRNDMSRGQREAVLGNEIGVDDAYTRGPMSSLQAA